MYATEIAINHLIPDLSEAYLTENIDSSSYREDLKSKDIVSIHCLHNVIPFHKFTFHEVDLPNFLLKNETDRRVFLEEILTPLSAIPIEEMNQRQYATYVIWRSVAANIHSAPLGVPVGKVRDY